jgi:hypothetical protein
MLPIEPSARIRDGRCDAAPHSMPCRLHERMLEVKRR